MPSMIFIIFHLYAGAMVLFFIGRKRANNRDINHLKSEIDRLVERKQNLEKRLEGEKERASARKLQPDEGKTSNQVPQIDEEPDIDDDHKEESASNEEKTPKEEETASVEAKEINGEIIYPNQILFDDVLK